MKPKEPGGRIVSLDAPAHQEVQLLLPWLLTGRLEEPERAHAQAHVANCPKCQADLAWERALQARYAHLETEADVDRSLAALRERLDAPEPASPMASAAERLRRRWQSLADGIRDAWQAATPALRGTLALQGAAIAALCAGLLFLEAGSRAPAYHTLSAPAHGAPAADAVVRFRPDAQEQAIRTALQRCGARVVDGPTASGAYLLQLPAADRGASLERLRADGAVLLAESLQ
jgi:hypothetical protein